MIRFMTASSLPLASVSVAEAVLAPALAVRSVVVSLRLCLS